MQTPSKTSSNKLLYQRILLAGVVAGALDDAAAIINYYVATGKNPVRIFVFIASGVFGKQAYSGSQSIAIFGVLFHFLIAIIFSAFYFWIYPKIQFLHIAVLILTGCVGMPVSFMASSFYRKNLMPDKII